MTQHFMTNGCLNVLYAVGLIHVHMNGVVASIKTALDTVFTVVLYSHRDTT